ncbi:hypothetical protein F5Y17DRAFT_167977 [Xylariaceae sp. FL0594]|nr:hypothetical protein F5Y17DRAFT_167977 [Xylariaceae sp. FL0594]
MSFNQPEHNNSDLGDQRVSCERPRFNSMVTSDRLEQGARLTGLTKGSKIRKGRRSVFREVGLDDEAAHARPYDDTQSREEETLGQKSTKRRPSEPVSPQQQHERKGSTGGNSKSAEKPRWLSRLASVKRPKIQSSSTAPPLAMSGVQRLSLIALLIAVVLPAIRFNNGHTKVDVSGADAGVIREPIITSKLVTRDSSPTDVCKRWAAQSAIVNGTLYYYGGRSKTSADQENNEWNNDFITIDLTKSWDVSSPAVKGLPQPSGPPAVSLGYLWNDLDRLYLYGGEFDLSMAPLPVSTWQYDIASSTWTEFTDPRTLSGAFSDAGGAPVQRAAEGAGVSVPELGLSWYFGGHLDLATTPGWSNQIPRMYLKSLLEFTHPGYSNVQIDSLRNSGAPEGGAYRNITWAGTQNQEGFTERADGVLVYVPGWGSGGILLGLGGGVVTDHDTTDAFSSMDTIDVYDIASSQWYHQETSGSEKPQVRVNPCAVVFSAPDASSFNIYMYGGQNLLPVGHQTQYTDVWILTIPSFTWIKVDVPSDNEPAARAGHSCAPRDGQIVVVGGYISDEKKCESPGIYAFDASKLSWKSSFDAGDHPADAHADNTVLAGSYGYLVPDAVQSVIGGSSEGGATATQPASGPATGGPFKTGVPPVFTVTAPGSAGPTATVTSSPGATPPGGLDGNGKSDEDDSRRAGTIAAGVIAGLAGLLALYLGFCAWLWRRQVRAYKRHMAVANQYQYEGEDDLYNDQAKLFPAVPAAAAGGVLTEKLRKNPAATRGSSAGGGVAGGGGDSDRERDHFSWVGVGEPVPKFLGVPSSSDEPSPGSNSGTGTGTGTGGHRTSGSIRQGGPRPSEDRNPWGFSGSAYDNYPGDVGGSGSAGIDRSRSDATRSTRSGASAEALLDGREPNFFSVVLGPRRALRVVNGMESE